MKLAMPNTYSEDLIRPGIWKTKFLDCEIWTIIEELINLNIYVEVNLLENTI